MHALQQHTVGSMSKQQHSFMHVCLYLPVQHATPAFVTDSMQSSRKLTASVKTQSTKESLTAGGAHVYDD